MREGIPQAIREAGGAVYAVTSESQTLASEAERDWELDFPSIGDPHHEIADECRERGWLHLFINRATALVEQSKRRAAHPKGYFQPGVLAVTRAGRVLYRWRGRPTRRNMGGAAERPVGADVWAKVRAALRAGDAAGDAAMDVPERTDLRGIPWPLFVTLLLANGGFLRPKPFPLGEGGMRDVNRRAVRALLRVPFFLGAWILGFLFLPTWLMLTALVGWGGLVARPLMELHREFQNVPHGEPEASPAASGGEDPIVFS